MNSWLLAIRPKTLPAAIAPVLIGTAMAMGDGVVHWPAALACLMGALFIQIGTNLSNDYFDFKKGADTKDRQGPIRVTQAGLIPPQRVLLAAVVFFVLAVFVSVYLIHRAGLVILLIAIVSVLSGIFYTAGSRPLGYMGLGELFVFIFFGPVAVGGTYFVQALDINLAVIVAGCGPGFLSCAILAVNNLRDMDGDRLVGKMTLAVQYGRSFAISEYLFFILAATITPFVVFLITHDHWSMTIASIIGFVAIDTVKTVMTSTEAFYFNYALAQTGRWLLLYSMLFSLGWVLCSR